MYYALDNSKIKTISEIIARKIIHELGDEVVKCILFGSCARGDYNDDSDIDIAVITKSNREKEKMYREQLIDVATDVELETFSIINIICIPYLEFEEKKGWYELYKNIEQEGVVLSE